MENMSREQILLFAIVALVIWGMIIYNIIKMAVISGVKQANKDLYTLLKSIGNLKINELKKKGFTEDELQGILERSDYETANRL